MKLSKTTINKGRRNGLEIVLDEIEDKAGEMVPSLEIYGIGEDGELHMEYTAAYRNTDDGLFFSGGCFDTEDMPHWIKTERALRDLIPAFAAVTPA